MHVLESILLLKFCNGAWCGFKSCLLYTSNYQAQDELNLLHIDFYFLGSLIQAYLDVYFRFSVEKKVFAVLMLNISVIVQRKYLVARDLLFLNLNILPNLLQS